MNTIHLLKTKAVSANHRSTMNDHITTNLRVITQRNICMDICFLTNRCVMTNRTSPPIEALSPITTFGSTMA